MGHFIYQVMDLRNQREPSGIDPTLGTGPDGTVTQFAEVVTVGENGWDSIGETMTTASSEGWELVSHQLSGGIIDDGYDCNLLALWRRWSDDDADE